MKEELSIGSLYSISKDGTVQQDIVFSSWHQKAQTPEPQIRAFFSRFIDTGNIIYTGKIIYQRDKICVTSRGTFLKAMAFIEFLVSQVQGFNYQNNY